jgi:hypothetical protein
MNLYLIMFISLKIEFTTISIHPSLFSIMTSRQHNRNKSSVSSNSKHSLNQQSSSKRSPSRSPGKAPTFRRLLDEDVRAIFECLHQKAPLPVHLKFKIVPVGPTGLKLSPPAFEFAGTSMCNLDYVNVSYVLFWAASHTLSLDRSSTKPTYNTQTVSMFCCVHK